MKDVIDIKKNIRIVLEILPFIVLDLGLRYLTYDNYKFYSYLKYSPLGFTLAWSILLVGLSSYLPQKWHKRIYILSLVVSILLAYSEYIHMKILGSFYGLSSLFLIKEGSYYFKYACGKKFKFIQRTIQ